jgi:hypothetical protein
MSPEPALRSTRATVFAAVCMILATAGHAAAAHAAVAPWAIGAGFAGVLVVAWALTGAERSLATILGGLLGGQFMLHSLFMSAAGHRSVGGGAMVHDSMHVVTASSGSGDGGAAMTFAHVAAAVVSAWWLRRGERAVWSLARRAAALAARPFRALLRLLGSTPLARVAVPVFPPCFVAYPGSGGLLLRHSVTRRGPPSCSTVLI